MEIASAKKSIHRFSYLKAGLETGAKAEADAKQAAIQKAVFMVVTIK